MVETQTINVVGNILGCSGYDSHTRSLANALSKITDVKLITQVPQNAVTQLTDKELEMIKRSGGDINLIITSPVYWKVYLTNKRNWVYLICEGDKIPVSYYTECLNPEIEYILVASNHSRDAILNTANDFTLDKETDTVYNLLKDKIKVINHGVDPQLFYPKETKRDRFTFLANKGFRHSEDRGGIQYLIRAYIEAFTDKDNVLLILKINPAYGIPNMVEVINKISPRNHNIPNIQLIVDNVPYNRLVDLYNQCDVFVSPTRSEAFNIPCLEAMACGKPVITTSFGGQTDYVNDTNGWLISGELEPVTWELQYEGIKWLTPNINLLKNVVLRASKQELEVLQKGAEALNTSKQFTWDETARKVKELI